MEATTSADLLLFTCPHDTCGGTFVIHRRQLNCHVLRHGVFRATGQPVPPHASQVECDAWATTGALWGCGRPVRIVPKDAACREYEAVVCEYV